MKKHKFLLVGLLLVIISVGFINLPRVEAQTAATNAAYIQQLINQLLSLVAQLRQQLAIMQGQQRQTDTPPPSAPASLSVSSPATNSSWTSSNGPVIQWSSANIPAGNAILVELLTLGNQPVSGFNSFSTNNDGSQSGNLTNSTVASGWYYFRLSTVVNGQTIYGGSGVFQFSQPTTPVTTYTLNLITAGTGSGLTSRSPNQTNYPVGTVVTITASPTNGSTFTGWSGALVSTANPATITMTGDKNVYANFAAAPTATPSITISSPTTNSSWTSSNGPVIQWSSSGIPSGSTIKVELLTPSNGQVSGFSSFTTANDGSQSGNLTNSTVASGWYYFRLATVVNGQTVYGGSGVFQFSQAPPSATCGNGIMESGEQCDGTNFGGNTCANYGYTSGNLSCSASCTLSASQCSTPPVTASITISSPTASSRWTPTAFTHSVIWTTSNIPSSDYLTLELMTPANQRVNAFTAVSSVNDGSQAVNISNIAPGYYWFRLTATLNGQTIYGGSPVFQVISG